MSTVALFRKLARGTLQSSSSSGVWSCVYERSVSSCLRVWFSFSPGHRQDRFSRHRRARRRRATVFAVRDVRVLREQRPQSQRAETTVRRRSRSARARRNQRSKTSVKRASRTVRRTCRSIAPLPRRSIRMRRISHSSPPKAIRAGSTSRSSTRGSFRCTAPISNRSHRRRGRRCSAKRRVFLRRRRSGRRMRRA